MLLLDVRVEIASSQKPDLDRWYSSHVPRLLSIPGYVSGRRYAALSPGPSHAALYEIDCHASVPSLLGEDSSMRHPLTLSEWSEWEESLVPHMSHCSTNLYETAAASGCPILHGNYPIIELRFNTALTLELFDAAWESTFLPRLIELEDVVSAAPLVASSDPEVTWLNTKPQHLILLETAGVKAARATVASRVLRQLIGTHSAISDLEMVAYRQFACHVRHDP